MKGETKILAITVITAAAAAIYLYMLQTEKQAAAKAAEEAAAQKAAEDAAAQKQKSIAIKEERFNDPAAIKAQRFVNGDITVEQPGTSNDDEQKQKNDQVRQGLMSAGASNVVNLVKSWF